MEQSADDCASSVRFWAAAFLLLVPAVALGAEDFDLGSQDGNIRAPLSAATETSLSVEPPAPDPSWSGDCWICSRLTEDWLATRDHLAECGLTFYGDITQYYQGVTAGGLARQFRYGGRADYLIDFDSEKMGLWKGGHLDLRGESRLGQDTNRIDGALSLSNFAMALPRPSPSVTALTGVQFTQALSDQVSVFAGKMNLLDGTPAGYSLGRRWNYFLNVAMQSNLSRIYVLTSTLGGGLSVRDESERVFNFFVLDTHFTPTTGGFSELFSNGMVAYGEYRIPTNWFELPGHSVVGFLYSNATRTTLDRNQYLVLPEATSGNPLPTRFSAWTATYRFDQVLYADAEDPRRNRTLSGDLGLTDGNPNPIHWFANVSLMGHSPIAGREADTIGIGYYHLGVSKLPILKALGFEAEDGVELFYNAAVTPWFHVTPDLQVLAPSQRSNSTAILVGVRGRVSF